MKPIGIAKRAPGVPGYTVAFFKQADAPHGSEIYGADAIAAVRAAEAERDAITIIADRAISLMERAGLNNEVKP